MTKVYQKPSKYYSKNLEIYQKYAFYLERKTRYNDIVNEMTIVNETIVTGAMFRQQIKQKRHKKRYDTKEN